MKQVLAILLLAACASWAQAPYTPKFPGDPAHSNAEAAALGYMRTVVGAQREYKKKHGDFATSLAGLVHSGSFTRRMVSPNRGDYTVHFRGKKDAYSLQMVPKQFDADHRAFYTDESGKIRAETDKPAGADSPILK